MFCVKILQEMKILIFIYKITLSISNQFNINWTRISDMSECVFVCVNYCIIIEDWNTIRSAHLSTYQCDQCDDPSYHWMCLKYCFSASQYLTWHYIVRLWREASIKWIMSSELVHVVLSSSQSTIKSISSATSGVSSSYYFLISRFIRIQYWFDSCSNNIILFLEFS